MSKGLKKAILRNPIYVSGDDSLKTDADIVKTATLVLDRIADDCDGRPFRMVVNILFKERHQSFYSVTSDKFLSDDRIKCNIEQCLSEIKKATNQTPQEHELIEAMQKRGMFLERMTVPHYEISETFCFAYTSPHFLDFRG